MYVNKRNTCRKTFLSLAAAILLTGVAAEGALAMADAQGHEPHGGADRQLAGRSIGGPVHWLAVDGTTGAALDERYIGGRVGWVTIPTRRN